MDTQLHNMPGDIVQNIEESKGNQDSGTDKGSETMDSKTEQNNNENNGKQKSTRLLRDQLLQGSEASSMQSPAMESIKPREGKRHSQDRHFGEEEEKRTRSQRKRKYQENFSYYLDESDALDLSGDSSSQEYKPSEDEESDSTKKRKRMSGSKTNNLTPQGKEGSIHKLVMKKPKKAKVATLQNSSSQTTLDMPDIFNEHMSSPPAKVSRKKRTKKRKIGVSDEEDSETSNDTDEEDEESRVTNDGKKSATKFSSKISSYGQPYSKTGSWYIASGYLEDLLELLRQFENEKSWRFSAFSSCWREMKFSLIYRGRQSFKELLEFSEEVADITKRFLAPSQTTKMRVGALYTLYGLYYKHPIRHFFKIRIVKNEYYYLKELVEPFRYKAENPDPAVLFRTLETDGAFYHTATTQEMCLDFHSAEREEVGIKYELQRIATTSAVSLNMPMDVLETDEALMQHYDNIKTALLDTKTSSGKAVSMVDKSITSEVKNAVLKLNEDLLVAVGIKNPVESTNEAQQTSWLSDIGKRRSEVRNKAVSSSTTDDYVKRRGLLAKKKCKCSLIMRGGKMHYLKGCSTHTMNLREEGVTDSESDMDKSPTSTSKNNKKASRTSRRNIGQMLTDEKIRDYMKPPSAEVTNTPVRSMGTIKAVRKSRRKKYKHTKADKEDADDPLKMNEGESFCGKNISIPEHKNISGETNKHHKRIGRPGRPPGRPRKNPLPQNSFPAQVVEQSDSNNQIVTPDTSITMPLKREKEQDEQRHDIMDDRNELIILNVQISSDVIHHQSKKFKILKSSWKAISEDAKKLFELKKKFLGLMLPGREITDDDVTDIYAEMTVIEPPVRKVENTSPSSCTSALEQTPKLMSGMTSKYPLNKKGENKAQGNTVKQKGVLLMQVRVGGVTRLLPVPGSAKEQNEARKSMLRPDTKFPLDPVPFCTTSHTPDLQNFTQINGGQVTNICLPRDELDIDQTEGVQRTDSVMESEPQLPELSPLNLDPLFLEGLPIRKREVSYQQVPTETSPIKQDMKYYDSKGNSRAKYKAGNTVYSTLDSFVGDDAWNSDENSDVQNDSYILSKSEGANNNSPLSSDHIYTSPKSQRENSTSTNSLESRKILPRVIHSSDPWLNHSAEGPALPLVQTLNTREQGQTSRYQVQVPPLTMPLQTVMQHPDSNLVPLPQQFTIISDSASPVLYEMPPLHPVQEVATSNAFIPPQTTSDCVTLLAQGVPSNSFTSQYVVLPHGSAQSCSSPVSHIPRPSTSGHYAEVQENLNMRCVPLVNESQQMLLNGTPSKVSNVPKISNIALQTTPYSERLTKNLVEDLDVGDEKKMGGSIHSPNQLQTPSQISRVIPFTSTKEVTRAKELPGETSKHSSSEMPKQSTYNSQKLRQGARSSPVCTFLYSPKYKALSKFKETGGIATGTPVHLKDKPRVPFILKHSLVQKHKGK